MLAPEVPVHDHSREAISLARLLCLPLPDNVDGSQVGGLAWQVCPALAESAGQLSGHRHRR